MIDPLATLLQHGFGRLLQFPDGRQQLTLTFTPRKGERLTDLQARIAAQREPQDAVRVTMRGGQIAQIDVTRDC